MTDGERPRHRGYQTGAAGGSVFSSALHPQAQRAPLCDAVRKTGRNPPGGGGDPAPRGRCSSVSSMFSVSRVFSRHLRSAAVVYRFRTTTLHERAFGDKLTGGHAALKANSLLSVPQDVTSSICGCFVSVFLTTTARSFLGCWTNWMFVQENDSIYGMV